MITLIGSTILIIGILMIVLIITRSSEETSRKTFVMPEKEIWKEVYGLIKRVEELERIAKLEPKNKEK